MVTTSGTGRQSRSGSIFEYTAEDDPDHASLHINILPAAPVDSYPYPYSNEPLQCFTWPQMMVALLAPYPTAMYKGGNNGWQWPCRTLVPLAQLLGWRVYRFGTLRNTLSTWSFFMTVLFLCFAITFKSHGLVAFTLLFSLYFFANGLLLTLSPGTAYLCDV